MNNRVVRIFILLAAMSVLGSIAAGQTGKAEAEIEKYVNLLRKDLRSDKKQFLAVNMPLTEAEAVKFWPVYEQYATELAQIFDTRIALIKEYAENYNNLTDASAGSLIQRTVDSDQEITRLRQKYLPIVSKVLPGKKAALFFQIEKRLGLLIDLQLAAELPLITN